MAGEDFDGDDDDEVTKMGFCRVLVYRPGWHTGFQVLKGLAPYYLAKQIQNEV